MAQRAEQRLDVGEARVLAHQPDAPDAPSELAEAIRLPSLTTLRLPPSVLEQGEANLRRRILDRYGIELGGGLGKLAGSVWRIGLMGENARFTNVESLLCALHRELD